jgi:hypothetical protein
MFPAQTGIQVSGTQTMAQMGIPMLFGDAGTCNTAQNGCESTASCNIANVPGVSALISASLTVCKSMATGTLTMSFSAQGQSANCTYDINYTKM